MKKKFFAVFWLALLLALSAAPVAWAGYISSTAYVYPVTGGNLYFEKETGTITACDDGITDLVIPEKIDGVTVQALAATVFQSQRNLTNVTIPATVTSIGEYAFNDCRSLVAVNVAAENPSFVSDDGVLFNKDKTILITCPMAKSGTYVIPDGVTEIGTTAFSYCENLTAITIPNSVTTIGKHAFVDCTSLTSINIPNSVTSIGEYAFDCCSSLSTITIPASVESIGERLFTGCTNLATIEVDSANPNYASLDNVLFNKQLTILLDYPNGKGTTYTIPNTVTSIANMAFDHCNITSVVIPDSVISIGDDAFGYCTDLTNIEIPNSVTSIGSGAFNFCNGLTTVIIPDSVKSIGGGAFSYCASLSKLIIPGNVVDITGTISNSGALKTAGPLDGGYDIEFGWTKEIPANAFLGCENLTSITLPDGLTKIGDNAFSRCNNITAITIPDTVTSIGENAFFELSKLTDLTLSNNLTSIGQSAFSNCTALSNVTIPGSVKEIGHSAFGYCSGLVSLTLSEGVENIDSLAFQDCTNLVSITIPGSMKNIDGQIFEDCSSLQSVILEDGITNIGLGVFRNCSALKEVTIPKSVTSIHDMAFEGCALTDIYYGGSKKSWPKIQGNNYVLTQYPDVTIHYAIDTFNVSFESNGAGGTMETVLAEDGEDFVLPQCGFIAPSGKRFKAWQIDGKEYAPGSTYKVTGNIVASAVWEEYTTYNVTYDANGGSGEMPAQQIEENTSLILPECIFTAPTGQEFKTWQISGTDYAPNATYKVNADTIVMAVWQDKQTEPEPEKPADKVDKELQDILDNTQATTDEIKDALEDLAKGDLKEIIKDVVNNKFNDIFDKIEELENKIQGSATINVEAGLGFVNTGVKVVGAKLNFDYESNVRLDIGKPHDENIEVEKPQNTDLFRFSMQLIEGANNNVTELTVPVRVTLPVPGRNPVPQSVKLWHFHNGRLVPVEFTREPFQENGQWYVTFKISGFSDFIMEYAEQPVADTYKITFDLNDGILADSVSNPVYVVKGEKYTMPTANKSGYTLKYWAVGEKESANTVKANEIYTFTADTTVYAIWDKRTSGGGHSSRPNTSGGGTTTTPTKPGTTEKPGTTGTSSGQSTVTAQNINNKFADVQNNAWYSEAIAYVYNKGMMNGTDAGRFEPNAATTRAMLVTMLFRLEGEPAAGAANFSDVASGQWFSDAIAWASAQGVVNGYENGRFAPNDALTREQLAAILYRFAQLKGQDVNVQGSLSGFSDSGSVSGWAAEAMQWAVGAGIINGDNGALNPGGNATRAEVAMMLMRYLENVK